MPERLEPWPPFHKTDAATTLPQQTSGSFDLLGGVVNGLAVWNAGDAWYA